MVGLGGLCGFGGLAGEPPGLDGDGSGNLSSGSLVWSFLADWLMPTRYRQAAHTLARSPRVTRDQRRISRRVFGLIELREARVIR